MSDYIRATSNPEGLCVTDAAGDTVQLYHAMKAPLAGRGEKRLRAISVPRRIFFQACRDWVRPVGTQRIRDGELRIEEVFVFLDTGKRVPVSRCDDPDVAGRPKAFLIRFSYRGEYVHLWRVTWEHVVGAVLRKDEMER